MTQQHRKPSVYDRINEQLDAADLIRRLGLQHARTIGAEAYCVPLCHESTSGESLQINLHTGRWNCKACQDSGYSGDLIQLVEYVLANGAAPSHGAAQAHSPSHRAAIAWLCEQYGIAYEPGEGRSDPALEVVHLFAMHAHSYLLRRPDVLEWIQAQWGFDLSTVEAHGIGFVPSPVTPELAKEAGRAESKSAFRSSGIGFYVGSGKSERFATRFEGRVVFPYLENGRAVYLIGRSTPWTPAPDDGRRAPKYHKLTVHSADRPWISERVTNDHLYNEPVLSGTDRVVVAEGVADAVALSCLGVPVVSPVTVSFNATDLERFVTKVQAAGIGRVEILFDNELSGSGNHGARETGRKLVERGLQAVVLTLPLGPTQAAARDEVLEELGEEAFREFERAKPRRRKEILQERIPDPARREWVQSQVALSKIDAAEWCAAEGAGAAGKLDSIRRKGRDVVELEAEDNARGIQEEDSPVDRLDRFAESIELAAHVDEVILRGGYARFIAKLAGQGVLKSAVEQRIARARKTIVKPKREEAREKKRAEERAELPDLVLPPPTSGHVQPAAPQPPPGKPADTGPRPADGLTPPAPGAPPAPSAPQPKKPETEHERFASARRSVLASVEARVPEERIGEFVAQMLTRSMGYTPFLTPEELYLVRGSERIAVGLRRRTPEFATVTFLVSGLTSQKASHRSYIDVAVYFLKRAARAVADVSWSHVSPEGDVYFPTADPMGTLLRLSPNAVSQTRMSEARVPAVAGPDFLPFTYTLEGGGIDDAIEAFGWTSLAPGERMVLVYWIVTLPLLRRIGSVPIVRIEGGSSSGKTRAVDAVSFLVNGRKSSSVPTAAALISRMSVEMLTIDDNREANDVTPTFLGTLLQATNLGAREKRRGHSDTGTIIERVCGGLLMNGIEPVHSGRSELASRMLVMRCEPTSRAPGSPSANEVLFERVLGIRNRFWSESLRRCAAALALDAEHGEHVGALIEELFGETRIGRLSSYLRMMYLTAVAGMEPDRQQVAVREILPTWADAFSSLGRYALDSLVREELAVSAIRYALSYARSISEPLYTNAPVREACNGKYKMDEEHGDEVLGPLSAPQLARLVRSAGKELNAPRAITTDLRAGQLEARILDGIGFLESAGVHVEHEPTNKGKVRFTFYRQPRDAAQRAEPADAGTVDTFVEPDDWTS